MVLYYTATSKTKVFACALAELLTLPVQELKSTLNQKSKFVFLCQSVYLGMFGKHYPVENMPSVSGAAEIYLCAPVWGGHVASPGLYFLEKTDLKNIKVNLLLTCGSIASAEKYKKKAEELLAKTECIPGAVYMFATGKKPTDKENALEQMREILPG